MSFDLAAALRRHKPQRAFVRLTRRLDAQLPWLAAPASPGPELLLDTCVYLDVLQGRTPPEVDELLALRIANHSTVALAELTHAFGRLDPAHPNTRAALRELGATLSDIPPHRLAGPSARAAGEAGIVAGLIARLSGRAHGGDLINDASIALQSVEAGCVLLTRNIADFDLLQQVVPSLRLLLYRHAPPPPGASAPLSDRRRVRR